MGCDRFAEDTDQELTDFYSINKRGKGLILQVVIKEKKTTSENIHWMNSNLKINMKFGSWDGVQQKIIIHHLLF